MANLTVVIDAELLKRARMKALEDDTSVNAIVREALRNYADSEAEARAARERIAKRAMRSRSGSGTGGRTWTRDELYDR